MNNSRRNRKARRSTGSIPAAGRNGPLCPACSLLGQVTKKICDGARQGRSEIAGPIGGWGAHLERAAGIGFSHVCTGPIFAFAPDSDAVLIEDYERADAAIGDGPADDGVRRLAEQAGTAVSTSQEGCCCRSVS